MMHDKLGRQPLLGLSLATSLTVLLTACGSSNFSASAKSAPPTATDPAPPANAVAAKPTASPPVETKTQPTAVETANSGGTVTVVKSCSQNYAVPGTANPFFAGVAAGATLTYQVGSGNPVDSAPATDPILVTPIGNCIVAGNTLHFTVSGTISHASGDDASDANGVLKEVVAHQLGASLGKSDIHAPINSLLGVFLSDQDPSHAAAPATLDFSTQAARDYATLSPQLGQVFFIGTGKTSTGDPHKVVVPKGAARLYFAIMDSFQWNNNLGSLTGAIAVETPGGS